MKKGQGPYQAIQEAIRQGKMPNMSHKEILQEARRIRDRELKGDKKTFKVGEKLNRYSTSEIDQKVEGERKRLQGTQSAAPPGPVPEQDSDTERPTPTPDPGPRPAPTDETPRPAPTDETPRPAPGDNVPMPRPRPRPDAQPNPEVQTNPEVPPENRPESELTPEERITQSRQQLERTINRTIKDPNDRAAFQQNMKAFEERATRENLSPDEVTSTYDALSKLMGSKLSVLSPEQRSILGQNAMHHAADPKNIDQGTFDTCNVTTMQENLFTTNPSKMAEMLTSAALTGSYTAPDGRQIKLDRASMQALPGADKPVPTDGDRSYATQVLNHVMVNEISQRKGQFYTQLNRFDESGQPLQHGDRGERLKDAAGNEIRDEKGNPMRHPGVYPGEMEAAMERYTGRTGTVLLNDQFSNGPGSDKMTRFNSAEDLGQKLQNGKMPMILYVNGKDPLFQGNFGPDQHGAHVITIRGYDPATGEVEISNQWGSSRDFKVKLTDLYRTTEPQRPAARSISNEMRVDERGKVKVDFVKD